MPLPYQHDGAPCDGEEPGNVGTPGTTAADTGELHCQVTVEAAAAGGRLDAYLAGALEGFSRSRVKALVKSGCVSIDGRVVSEPNYRIVAGEAIDAVVPAPVEAVPAPEAIPIMVVYEDDALIVVDKPAGLVVHPGAGNWSGTLVNALIHHCGESLSGIGGVRRPGIVHRIDKDTSGLLVVAKTDQAHHHLSAQFADHGRSGSLERAYTAFVWGVPDPLRGTIRTNIARSSHNRLRMSVIASGGRSAVTHYHATRPGAGNIGLACRAICRLETGRTHQIRVHMAHIGHPLLGDREYGQGYSTKAARLPDRARRALKRLNRQALHAHLLAFSHPLHGEVLRFESALPADLAELSESLTEN
ncbi:MAG: RluA family pseudouridine synthase [Pseudomonadota bacterium]